MKIRDFLIMICIVSVFVPNLAAETRLEVQNILQEEISEEEYEVIMMIHESTKKSIVDVFDDYIDPMREKQLRNALRKKYITPSKKQFTESKNLEAQRIEDVIEGKEFVDSEEPLNVKGANKRPKISIHRNKKVKKVQQKQVIDEIVEPKPTPELTTGSDEKVRDYEGQLKKRRKVIDRKKVAERTREERKKVSDYNRTKKQKKFGIKRIESEEEEVEVQRRYDQKGFKKKQFGSKVIPLEPEEEVSAVEEEDLTEEKFKKNKKRILRKKEKRKSKKKFGPKQIYIEPKKGTEQ